MTLKVAVTCGSAIFKRGGWEATGSTKKKKTHSFDRNATGRNERGGTGNRTKDALI